MKPAGIRLVDAMNAIEFKTPTIPVVHNVHAQTEDDPARIKALLGEQIYSPVQWTDCVQMMVRKGAQKIVECGPGKVLSGLNRRIDKSLQSFSLEDPEQLRQTKIELG